MNRIVATKILKRIVGQQQIEKEYLNIKADFSNILDCQYEMLYLDFKSKCRNTKYTSDKIILDSVALEDQFKGRDLVCDEIDKKGNLVRIIKDLSSRLKIESSYFNDDPSLIIESDDFVFLELPWEELIDGNIVVLRKTLTSKKKSTCKEDTPNNVLILISHARKNRNGTEKTQIESTIKDEACEVYGILAGGGNQPTFRCDKVCTIKHTTRSSLEACLNMDQYSYIHILMHGEKNGSICLEVNQKYQYEYIDNLSKEDLISLFSNQKCILVFLSCCYSGGYCDDTSSIAFDLVKSGSSRYSIGYNGTTKGDNPVKYAKTFYECLTTGKDIEDVYKMSLKYMYNKKILNKSLAPVLYLNN